MKLLNKVIVVTGAGSGIGRELVLCLLSEGARVAGVDRAPKSPEETADLTGRYKDQFGGFVSDVTDRSGVEALPEQVLTRFGSVDGIINNAGVIQPFCRLNDLDYATIERVLNVNLFGTQAAVKLMSEGLASELQDTRVRVTVVFPGAVATNIQANSGVSEPTTGEGSGAMKPLAASAAADIIVRGIERNEQRVFAGKDAALMDKLYRLAPGYASRVIAKKMRALLPA